MGRRSRSRARTLLATSEVALSGALPALLPGVAVRGARQFSRLPAEPRPVRGHSGELAGYGRGALLPLGLGQVAVCDDGRRHLMGREIVDGVCKSRPGFVTDVLNRSLQDSDVQFGRDGLPDGLEFGRYDHRLCSCAVALG